MSKYRHHLPQLKDALFTTDGGLETTLVFHEGMNLPYFAAFDLLKSDAGTERLRSYYNRYCAIARDQGLGIILESPTWRANTDWGAKLGYAAVALADVNRRAIGLMVELRTAWETPKTKIVISGNIGPRGDGYRSDFHMNAREARHYHRAQIETFAQTDADMVAAFTMNYVEEAIGIILAARDSAIPVAISFTLETDGRLPSGHSLRSAIELADTMTEGYPAYYMINCAHPTHFEQTLQEDGAWRERIRGLRANASKRSHAELDESPDLDAGDPFELGVQYRVVQKLLPKLTVVGGCCGTDDRHVTQICRALTAEVSATSRIVA